mmetsp:Transcript_58215/g.136423  ORF Transcript_58215/g.136423 Transcript_58215/m.136423 type:complete len:128 (-) Transcript_58215:205-588(-)
MGCAASVASRNKVAPIEFDGGILPTLKTAASSVPKVKVVPCRGGKSAASTRSEAQGVELPELLDLDQEEASRRISESSWHVELKKVSSTCQQPTNFDQDCQVRLMHTLRVRAQERRQAAFSTGALFP